MPGRRWEREPRVRRPAASSIPNPSWKEDSWLRRLIVLVTVLGLALALAATALGATVTVRVEGKTQSIFGSAPVKVDAPNALVALDKASTLGEFYFGLTNSLVRHVRQPDRPLSRCRLGRGGCSR